MPPTVTVVGAGRMGQGLARALNAAGWRVRLYARHPDRVPAGPVAAVGDLPAALAGAGLVLVAVPDDAIPEVAHAIRAAAPAEGQVVLHLSGTRDRTALSVLDGWAAGLGSFWPIQALADPAVAAAHWTGAFAGLEGDAAALAAGERLAVALGMAPVRIPSEAKALVHAGAVMTGNYVVTLLAASEQVAVAAGVEPTAAARMYLPLARSAVENVSVLGVVRALTGPVARGDQGTVRAHLEALSGASRELYVRLGLETLALAERQGLPAERAAEVRRVLEGR